MPYFHLFPFVVSEQYGEGEISRVDIFVSALHFFPLQYVLTLYPLEDG